MPNNVYPIRNHVYTLPQIDQLTLDDIPHLGFIHGGVHNVIQDSHMEAGQLHKVPGFSQLRWKFLHTTDEWIPVFIAVDPLAVLECVDVEPLVGDDIAMWVTPKGFPIAQFNPERDIDGLAIIPNIADIEQDRLID